MLVGWGSDFPFLCVVRTTQNAFPPLVAGLFKVVYQLGARFLAVRLVRTISSASAIAERVSAFGTLRAKGICF